MTEPARWITHAEPLPPLVPLAELTAEALDELVSQLNWKAFAALARASTDAAEEQEDAS